MDVVHSLTVVKKFGSLTYEEKLQVKLNGRPLPDINIEVTGRSRGKSYKRMFHRDIYTRNQWICGCNRKNALFCFPCILFGGDNSWTKTGITDLVHLSGKIKIHDNSKSHVYNHMELAVLGTANIRAQLDPAYWINIQKDNDQVTKNRYVLSKIINCVKFCGAFELALRKHDEAETSDNPGIFHGLINFSAELDKTLHEHLTIFKGTSKEIQNDLLDCMLQICQEEIAKEISETPFLAVMADETTDVSAKFQLVTILRYVRNGQPVERFWNFLVPENHDAATLADTILGVINPILNGATQKLIGQSYDGAKVMSDGDQGVQAKIRKHYGNAHFIHCYAHQLYLVMQKAASSNSQRLAVFDRIVGRKVPGAVPTRWNDNNIQTVNVVFENRETLIECMEELQEDYNEITCNKASAIQRMLEDSVFIFWLTFFHHVMPHVDILFQQLQKRGNDFTEVNIAINIFEKCISNIRCEVDDIEKEASDICVGIVEIKRKRLDHRAAAVEVCDVIINIARDRFMYMDHLTAATLFFPEKFAEYHHKFPEDTLNLTCSAYPVLNKERLKTELSVIYQRIDCRGLRGAVPFLKFVIQNNLEEPMRETKKLLEILLTLPMTTPEAERCFSTLKRIKTFLRNSMCEERLSALAMLSIERQFISNLPNFNDRVIDKFASMKDSRMELIFK